MIKAVIISDRETYFHSLFKKDINIERSIFVKGKRIIIKCMRNDYLIDTSFNVRMFSNPRNIMNASAVWIDFVNKYRDIFIDSDVVIVSNDSVLRYLAMYISKSFNIPILLVVNKIFPLNSYDYPLYMTSDMMIYKDVNDMRKHEKYFPFSTRRAILSDISKEYIKEIVYCINSLDNKLSDKVHKSCMDSLILKSMRNVFYQEKDINLLVVAYFAGDATAVGVFRANYWLSHIHELSNGKIKVDLATASYIPNRFYPKDVTVHRIKDFHAITLLEDKELDGWKKNAIQEEINMSKNFSTLSFYWRFALEEYFSHRSLFYDVVLLTGNPFPFFEFSKFCKRRWYSRVIYDYRDPFALNPRIKYSDEQKRNACNYERRLNYVADKIITVNRMCTRLICCENNNVDIIENGFDDSLVLIGNNYSKNKKQSGKIKIVYSGKLGHDRDLSLFIKLIDSKKYEFHFIGDGTGYLDKGLMKLIKNHGLLPYEKNLEILKDMHCGVVLISKHQFETPTKIYDYIAMGLDIVFIVEDGYKISDDFRKYVNSIGGCHLIRNNKKEISKFLRKYKYSGVNRDIMSYSRMFNTKKLIRHILKLAHLSEM